MPTDRLTITDYRALAEFRHQLRRFERFSERAARAAGLEPQQHQLLLAVKGLPAGVHATIGLLAERLQVQHHTAVELVDRMQTRGLVRRSRAGADRRRVFVHLTRRAEAVLPRLSHTHRTELRSVAPALRRTLDAFVPVATTARASAIDPLEILFVREVMRRNIVALPADVGLEALHHSLRAGGPRRHQLLYPVIDPESRLVGVVTRTDLQQLLDGHRANAAGPPLSPLIEPNPTVAYPDEPLRAVVYRMAETGLTRFPVIEREGGKLVGMIALFDLLAARVRTLEAERRRERVLPVRFFLPPGRGRDRSGPSVSSSSR